MSSSRFLDIKPLELQFPFELRRKVCCWLHLYNKTKENVGFKIQQARKTCPDKYFAEPNNGVMLPGSTCHIIIKMQAPLEEPPDLLCEDKLLIKSISLQHAMLAPDSKDIIIDMLMNDYCDHVDLDMVNIVYVRPFQPSFPVSEVSCGDSWTGVSGTTTTTVLITASSRTTDPPEKSSEVFCSLLWNKSLLNKKKGDAKENPVMVSSEDDDDSSAKENPLIMSSEEDNDELNAKEDNDQSNAKENPVLVSSEEDNDESNAKENSVIVPSEENNDESNEYSFDVYSDECYEIDHTSFTRKLKFDDMADVSLIAEKGPVALRDFPHPRHLCGCFPFKTTSPEQFCNKCFCCECEVASPCSQWNGINGHCHLTEKLLGGV